MKDTQPQRRARQAQKAMASGLAVIRRRATDNFNRVLDEWRALSRWSAATMRAYRRAPAMRRALGVANAWTKNPLVGALVLIAGVIVVTGALAGLNVLLHTQLPNPGVLYLPLVAMLAYHWGWRHALVGAVLELACVYFFFIPPGAHLKALQPLVVTELVVLAFVTGFVLALVQLARSRRHLAEREAGRFAALNRIGNSLAGELHEQPLLDTIAETARDLLGAEVAAFTLRPVDEHGRPQVPAEGQLFHLAAVAGVSPEQERLFRRMPLGGEGVLAPIFRHAMPVRVGDVLALGGEGFHGARDAGSPGEPAKRVSSANAARAAARAAAARYASGEDRGERLQYVGVPRGHPIIRSFLGAPLLDSEGDVRGGLLLGHSLPDQFTAEDQDLLVGIAAQAAVALENARLYRAARTQAQELDATFESISDGIMLVDREGVVLRENGAARELRAVLARSGSAAATESMMRAVVAQALDGGHTEGTPVTVAAAERETREYFMTGVPLKRQPARRGLLPSGAQNGELDVLAGESVVVVWHDVTATNRLVEEQRARADAETRQVLLRMIINELPSGVYLVQGRDARLVLANRAAEDVWGASWAPGQPMEAFLRTSGIRIYGPDGREMRVSELATMRAVGSGTDVRHHQEVIRQANGTSLPILLNAVALDPRALHLDVSALTGTQATGDAEADRRNAANPVALVVLQDVTALKEAERLKDDFIGVAAHELRTPLAALKGFAEMLTAQTARGKGQPLDAWQQEALEAIDQATVRLVDLIDDLLDVTRLQGGRLELHPEPHDLVALVRRVVRRLAVTADHAHIAVVAGADHVVACIDPPRVEQVVSNLISNAIKYSPDGGTIAIEIQQDDTEGMAVIAIQDHGIGIPTTQQAHIFGRFVRADNARDRGIAGTGLGLYLCRELVERHGGRIWFTSAEGAGTTFFVALPLNREPESGEATLAPSTTAPATPS